MKKFLSLMLCIGMILGSVVYVHADDTVELKVGDYVTLGCYEDVDILWRCVGIDDNGMLLLSDKVLCAKSFDAPGEHENDDWSRENKPGYREEYGSNLWSESNIRCWLNSDAPAGKVKWICGNAPSVANGVETGYDREEGFLNSFSASELLAVKEVTQKCSISDVDIERAQFGKESFSFRSRNVNLAYGEYVTDKFFLINCVQMDMVESNVDQLNWSLNDVEAASNVTTSEQKTLSVNSYRCIWYLRDPDPDCCSWVMQVGYFGDYGGGANENGGIRPAFYVSIKNGYIESGKGQIGKPYVLTGRQDGGNIYVKGYFEEEEKEEVQQAVQQQNGQPEQNLNTPANEPESNTQTYTTADVQINGELMNFSTTAKIINGRTLVPMRDIFETLGSEVEWNGDVRSVTGKKGNTSILLIIDNPLMVITKDGNMSTLTLDVPPMIINDRTMVPIRAVSETFGAEVNWNAGLKRVEIETHEEKNVSVTTNSTAPVSQPEVSTVSTFSDAESRPQICGICHGLGYRDCSICHGEGKMTKYTNAGTMIQNCTYCGGRGQISCLGCGGDGYIHD